MQIKRFGENKKTNSYDAFIEYEDGTKEDCTESTIELLWWSWITNNNAIREDKDGYVIFGYTIPQDYDKTLIAT